MISKYSSFIGEALLESAINESRIYYTIDFRKALHKVNHEIAKRLLEVEFDDVKPDMTLVDLSGKEDTITFSQMGKVTGALKKIVDEIVAKYGLDKDMFQKTIDGMVQKITDGTISTSEIEYILNDTNYSLKTKSRNEAKISKLVNSIFPNEYTDAEGQKKMREFLSKYAAAVSGKAEEDRFKLIEGEEIRGRYNMEGYAFLEGELGESCMRYPKCGKYLDIYVENPEVCKLLILTNDEDEVLGRALVWKIDILIEGVEYYMDRIYAVDDSIKEAFKEYADKKRWLKRLTSRYGDSRDFKFGEQEYRDIKATVQLKKWDFSKYPYMDTLKRLNKKNGLLVNDDENTSDCYIMTNTDGTYTDCSGHWSEYCECYIPVDEAVWSDPADSWIWRDNAFEVTIGSRRYKGWWPDDEMLVFDPYREEYVHQSDSVWCEYKEEYIYESDAIELITNVSGGDKGWDGYHLSVSTDTFSDLANHGIDKTNMACAEYLSEIGEYNDFYEDILSYNKEDKKYYITEFEVELYKTEEGSYSDIDCAILGIDRKDTQTTKTDEFAYNYNLEDKEDILKKCVAKIKEYDSIINGEQTRLEFEDDRDYIEKIEKIRKRFSKRKKTLEKWI